MKITISGTTKNKTKATPERLTELVDGWAASSNPLLPRVERCLVVPKGRAVIERFEMSKRADGRVDYTIGVRTAIAKNGRIVDADLPDPDAVETAVHKHVASGIQGVARS